MSVYARLAAIAVVVLAIAAAWWKFDRMLVTAERSGYARAQAEAQAAAELQRESNRGISRRAEEKQAAQAEVRTQFIVTTVKELVHETDNLAACVLTAAARQRLHDAARCAREDRPASCGAGDGMRAAR